MDLLSEGRNRTSSVRAEFLGLSFYWRVCFKKTVLGRWRALTLAGFIATLAWSCFSDTVYWIIAGNCRNLVPKSNLSVPFASFKGII